MRILLFGGEGQLGYELQKRARDLNFETVAPVMAELDIGDRGQVFFITEKVRPDVVINAAAYTAVDRAEQDREVAFRVNSDGAGHVAQAAAKIGVRVIHVSTDYVFDGRSPRPRVEGDAVSPLGVYGQSKLEGERQVLAAARERGLIVRTAWLHGMRGQNFLGTMLKLFAEKSLVRVVNDQVGSPTWAGWLAEVLLDLTRLEVHGILHATCRGSVSWYEFACAIRDFVLPEWHGPMATIEPQSTAEAARPAPRPAYSALDCSRLEEILGRPVLEWRDGVREHLKDLGYLKGNS